MVGALGTVRETGEPLTPDQFINMPEDQIKNTNFIFRSVPSEEGISSLQTELEKQLNDTIKSGERIDAGSLRNAVLKSFQTEDPKEAVKSFLFAAEKGLITAEPSEIQDAQAALTSKNKSWA
jgi:hypothetical protein